MRSWKEHQTDLARLAQAQLFFIGGAPRSGTTWLQCLLDSHPEVSCRGEGLFLRHLAQPLDSLIASRRDALAAKNGAVFRETRCFPLPEAEDADVLLGTAILLALERQRAGKACRGGQPPPRRRAST